MLGFALCSTRVPGGGKMQKTAIRVQEVFGGAIDATVTVPETPTENADTQPTKLFNLCHGEMEQWRQYCSVDMFPLVGLCYAEQYEKRTYLGTRYLRVYIQPTHCTIRVPPRLITRQPTDRPRC